MNLTKKEFELAKAEGKIGNGVTYRMYLSCMAGRQRTANNKRTKSQEEARNRATSLWEAKFKN